MKTNPIEEAANVFNSIDRWTAFYEMQQKIVPITEHWLTMGAVALRQEFAVRPSPSWKCADWGGTRDTRWFFDEEGGKQMIGIGIGWFDFELHLFHGGYDQEARKGALEVLESHCFEPLRILTGSPETRSAQKKEGSILSIQNFNPFDEVADPVLRQRIIAWHAGNNTAKFVEKTSAKIRQITENPEIVRLIRELNKKCLKPE